MKTAPILAVLAVAVFTMAPHQSTAQAFSVGTDGSLTQEKTAAPIPPEDQATKEQLGKLFDAMRLRNQMQSMRNIVPSVVEAQLRGQMNATSSQSSKLTPSQKTAVEKLVRKYVERAVNLYPVDEMIDDMTSIYQKYLTREDVDGMIAFYGSPAGQHLLDAQPKIAQEYMPLVMRRAQERSRALAVEMTKDMAELQQSQKRAPAAAPKK